MARLSSIVFNYVQAGTGHPVQLSADVGENARGRPCYLTTVSIDTGFGYPDARSLSKVFPGDMTEDKAFSMANASIFGPVARLSDTEPQ